MTRASRRAAMPESSAFVDAMRECFGEPVAIVARENGQTVRWRSELLSEWPSKGDGNGK
jgi:hypothetical protein